MPGGRGAAGGFLALCCVALSRSRPKLSPPATSRARETGITPAEAVEAVRSTVAGLQRRGFRIGALTELAAQCEPGVPPTAKPRGTASSRFERAKRLIRA